MPLESARITKEQSMGSTALAVRHFRWRRWVETRLRAGRRCERGVGKEKEEG